MYLEPIGYLQIPTGLPGTPGANGKTILNGTGAPASGLGVNGDFYLDTAASRLYGPKTDGAWGSGVSLIGATGNQLLSGSGVPSGGTGVNGDFYINTAANTIYGPKTGGSWGSATSLVGPSGANGITRLYELLSLTSTASTGAFATLDGYNVPANTLVNNGDSLKIEAWFTFTTTVSGTNYPLYRLTFAGQNATNTDGDPVVGSVLPSLWYRLEVEIIRVSSTSATVRYSWDYAGLGATMYKQKDLPGLDFTTTNQIFLSIFQYSANSTQLRTLTIDKISS